MLPIDAKFILDYILTGVIGILVFYGFFCPPARPKTEADCYLDEINRLKKNNKHLFGLYRNLENANVSLNWELRISQKRNNQSQLDQEKLNVELVRRENQIRSMSTERSQERKVVKAPRQRNSVGPTTTRRNQGTAHPRRLRSFELKELLGVLVAW